MIINQKKIMTYETVILLTITLITATIAWFVAKNRASASGLNLQIASAEYIKVSLTEDGEDITNLEENDRTISISLEELTNVEIGCLAPGTYGHLSLFITPLNYEADAYSMEVSMNCEFMNQLNGEAVNLTEAEQDNIKKLVSGHILFFEQRALVDTEYEYSEFISPTLNFIEEEADSENIEITRIDGTLTQNETTKKTIYWMWPYDYNDVPQNILPESEEAVKLSNLQIYYYNKFDLLDTDFVRHSKSELYDYADTNIATYIKNIILNIKVKGYHKEQP